MLRIDRQDPQAGLFSKTGKNRGPHPQTGPETEVLSTDTG
jgi:hypothetical protein